MNVKGFTPDGISEILTSTNNETFIETTRRFQKAVLLSPSEETENELKKIIKEISEKRETDYEKMLTFQCSRELAKSMMKRGNYSDAKQYLIKMLKVDSTRANLWADLAICAEKTNNQKLMETAYQRAKKIRPELNIPKAETGIPGLVVDNIEPELYCFKLQTASWMCFLSALEVGNTRAPSSILELEIERFHVFNKDEVHDYYEPVATKQDNIEERDFRLPQRVGSCRGLYEMIVKRLKAQQISESKFLFNRSVREVTADLINTLAKLNYVSPIPEEIAMKMIDIGQLYVFDLLTTNTKLFIAELASVYQPLSVEAFLEDIMDPFMHKPNAIIRINFALLELAIRENDDTGKIMKLYNACQTYFTGDIPLNHAGRSISKNVLNEKLEQIKVLTTLDDPNSERTAELAKKWFPINKGSLQFLSLKNIVRLFLQFKDECVHDVLDNFLRMILPLIMIGQNDFQCLYPLFTRLHYPMNDECVRSLEKIFAALTEVKAPKTLRFECALSLGYASVNYDGRGRMMAKVHGQLGDSCSLQNGKFLELLISALINSHGNELDLTKAFSCYFSNFTLPSFNHGSKLVLRCSPLLQPFYEHLKKLDDSKSISNNNLFAPYLEIWMHYVNERDNESSHPCLHDIDGWRIYRVVKRKENNITKVASLPRGSSPASLLEDMLRNDPTNSPESRYALSKILIKQYYTQKYQEVSQRGTDSVAPDAASTKNSQKLKEALEIISAVQQNPWNYVVHAIVKSFTDGDKATALEYLWNVPPFQQKVKKEAKRLYWIMRYGLEVNTQRSLEMARMAALASQNLQAIFAKSSIPIEYSIIILTMVGKILNLPKLYQDAIDLCKGKIVLPHPYVELFKLLQPTESFKLISKLIKAKSMNINNFVHFEYKVPFLMSHPDDFEMYKREVLLDYVDAAVKSNNYLCIFSLVNPNNKTDRKLSKVFRDNRFIYGVDRVLIFTKYIAEVIKKYQTSKNKDISERAIDALIKGNLILQLKTADDKPIDESLSKELTPLVNSLKNEVWTKELDTPPPEDSTVIDLLNALDENEYEEEEEEEDGDFVDDSADDDADDGEFTGKEAQQDDDDGEEEIDEEEEEEGEAVATEGEGEEEAGEEEDQNDATKSKENDKKDDNGDAANAEDDTLFETIDKKDDDEFMSL